MKSSIVIAVTVAVVMSIVSCVSTPPQSPAAKVAPEWTLTTPAPDGTYTYFVSSSSDSAGDAALATEDAANALISQIVRYMGVEITVETSGVAKGTLDSYSAEVTNAVKQTGSGRVSGFTIKDRHEVRDGSLVTVYILAQYVTADLNKEKARIAAIFQEKIDAVAKPEKAGDEAAGDGRLFDAVKSYVEAAVAASGSDVENADIKMERTMNKARAILGKMTFSRMDSPVNANLGKDFPKPFQARLVFGDGGSGIPGAEVYVSYQRRQSSGRVVSKTERVLTDAQGVVSFVPPPPDFVGKATLTFLLNLDSTRDLLEKIPPRFDAHVEALEADMARRSVSFDYTVVSAARTVPTGVFVVDLADDGKPAGTNVAQGGLFETLAREKFRAGLAPIDQTMAVAMDDVKVLAAAKAQYGSALQRIIYGTAKIEKAEKDGGMWQVTARMSVRCLDFATGMVLCAVEKSTIVVGSDEASTRRNALAQVAKDAVAKELMVSLP